jgi:hypothetical protein
VPVVTPVIPVKPAITVLEPVTIVGDAKTELPTINVFEPTLGSTTKPTTVKIDSASEKFISKVTVVAGKVSLTPETGFSGKKTVTLTINEKGEERIVQVPITVLPEGVTKPVLTPTSANKSTIRWNESPNATSYTVLLNGQKVCTTSANNCSVNKILGPEAVIEVVSNGGDRTVSQKIEADFKQFVPIVVTRIVSATITKAALTSVDTKALDKVIALIKNQGFGTVVISQITTTKKTQALSLARIEEIKKYVASKTTGENVSFEVVPATSRTYFNNISVKG